MRKESLPLEKCQLWNANQLKLDIKLVNNQVPAIFNDRKLKAHLDKENIYLPIDIFGSSFFILSMYEENLKRKFDEHGRFSAFESYAYQNKFLLRPIVDEYLEILKSSINFLSKDSLNNHVNERIINPTCDVDLLFMYGNKIFSSSKKFFLKMLSNRKKENLINEAKLFFNSLLNNYEIDPFFKSIYWIMSQNEKKDNLVTFYFLTSFNHKNDGYYDIDSKILRKTLREIYYRGHQIGLHLNYQSFKNNSLTKFQVDKFRKILKEENISLKGIHSRQHYLRWKNSLTARNLEKADINTDSSLTYADYPGFRVGTGREFFVFDLIKRRKTNLLERPLVFMDNSVFDEKYMGLDYSDETFDFINNIKQTSLEFSGRFTFLWHNSELENSRSKEFYLNLI